MTDIANMNLRDIDRLLATTDLTGTEVFNALRDHFRANPNRNRLKKWERFFVEIQHCLEWSLMTILR